MFRPALEPFGAFTLNSGPYRLQALAHAVRIASGFHLDEGAKPTPIVVRDAFVHHGGEENVGEGSRLRAGEPVRADADDLK